MKLESKIESKVKETIKKYKICNKKEKVFVALSGGKDSTSVAYVLSKLGYKLEGIHIDLKIGKYSDDCLKVVVQLCEDLKIPLHVYDIQKEMGSGMCYLRGSIQQKQKTKQGSQLKNCAICGVLKKWILNKVARELKADKIATGHNLDDEAQTFLLNMFKGSPHLSGNTGPITRNISDKKFTPRIKPLFYVLEDDIREYTKKKKLPVVYEKCPCGIDSYRIQIRNFLETLPGKQKENVLKNFDLIKDKIKKKNIEMKYCECCGEPTRNKFCKRCELIKA